MADVDARQQFDDFIAWLGQLDQYVAPGLTANEYAAYLRKDYDTGLALFQEVAGLLPVDTGPLEPPPPGEDYEAWSEPKRRKANLSALRALRQMQGAQRSVPTPEERASIMAFSGWGGIKVSLLPEDPVLFSPEYVEGIAQFRRARQLAPGEEGWEVPTTNLFYGLANQYFTGLNVCRAMWALARKIAPVKLQTALEPAAGIGRFMRTTPVDEGVAWTAVENDKLLVQFLQAMYSNAQVFPSEFEAFASRASKEGRSFDLILTNPPYGKERPAQHRKQDPGGKQWRKPDNYFTARCADMLSPGGVMVTITPMGQVTGEDREHVKMRKHLFDKCHFAGGVLVPQSVFPNVSTVNFVIHAWVRLPDTYKRSLTVEDRRIIAGDYLEMEDGQKNIMGHWGKGRYGPILKGLFDPQRVANMVDRPLTEGMFHAIREWRESTPEEEAEDTTLTPVPAPVDLPDEPDPSITPQDVQRAAQRALVQIGSAGAGVVQQAAALAVRLGRFRAVAVSNPDKAEAGRQELRADIEQFLGQHGNPHDIEELIGYRDMVAPLLAAVSKAGQLVPMLTQKLAVRESNAPHAGSPVTEIVTWYSKHNGVCTEKDLERHHSAVGAFEVLVARSDVAIELQSDGSYSYYRLEQYLTGALYKRLDAVNALLAGEVAFDVRQKLEAQKKALLTTIDPKTLSDIDPNIRAGYLVFDDAAKPYQLLQDFVNDTLQEELGGHPNIELFEESGVLRARTNDSLDRGRRGEALQHKWLLFFLGYYNRQLEMTDPDETAPKKTRRYETADMEARMQADQELETAFASWLAGQLEWRQLVEDRYNRLYRGFVPPEYDDSPIDIARMAPTYILHPHQNSGARMVADKRGGILAFDVGLGKCVEKDTLLACNTGLVTIGSLFGDHLEGPEDELVLLPPADLKVLAHGQDGAASWRPVRRLYRQRISDHEALRVLETTRGCRVEPTSAHPLPVVRDGCVTWVPTGEIEAGDWLAVPKRLTPPPALPAQVAHLDPQRLEDLALLMVWQVAEGHDREASPSVQTSHTTTITQKLLPGLLEDLQARFRRCYPDSTSGHIRTPADGKYVPYLEISSKAYRQEAEALGFKWGVLSAGRELPPWLPLLPDDLLATLTRAFFDAEGSCTGDVVEVLSASRLLLEQVQYMLLRFGVRSSLKYKRVKGYEHNDYWRITFSGEDAVAFHKHVGFGVDYKQAALGKLVSKTRNPNVGIPIRDLVDELLEAGFRRAWLYGHGNVPKAGVETISVERAQGLVQQWRAEASELGIARYAASSNWRNQQTHESLVLCGDRLLDAANRLEALVDSGFCFERVASVEQGQVGGFVYDIEVDAGAYDDKNYVGGAGGLILHNTFTALAAAAKLRQDGKVQRPIIVSPNSVLPTWYSEARKLLPDYRIGVIGITPSTSGAPRDDTADERRVKWNRFAQGDYDLLMVPYSNFLDDVAMEDSSIHDILSQVFWFQYKLGLEAADRRLTQRRIDNAQEELAERREERQEDIRYLDEDHPDIKKLDKKIKDLERQIKGWSEDLKAPSDNIIEQVRQDLENVRETKPFRPRRKPPREWSKSQRKAELIAFAKRKGLDLEHHPTETTSTGKPRKMKKKEIVAVLEERFPPPDYDGPVPVPPMITWEELRCDFLVVDEAHNFKNLWFAERRVGEDKIEFMGSGSGITIRAWDMFLKCQYLLGNHDDSGVCLLTATPLKNSPLEVYNLMSLVSRNVWSQRRVRNAEEFIDRYCGLEVEPSGDPATNEVVDQLAVTEFLHLDELRDIILAHTDRKLTNDPGMEVFAQKVPRVGNTGNVQVVVDMDDEQRHVVDTVKEVIKDLLAEEKERAQGAGESAQVGGIILRQMDMLSKSAFDVRLLREDIYKTQEVLAKARKINQQWDDYQEGKRKRRPSKKGLSSEKMASLQTKLDILTEVGIGRIAAKYAAKGTYPPKYMALVEKILVNPACGHIIFSDYTDTHEWMVDAIVANTRIPRDRIAFITGEQSKGERLVIADGFNGRSAIIDEQTGAVIQEALEPKYDVVIGTSGAMAEGLNLQARTCAIHHMTLPWEAATIQQRNGRGVRQGNSYQLVNVWYYITSKSFDGFKLNMVMGKQGWMESLWDDSVTEMNNPAAGMRVDRMELLIWIFASDESEARIKVEEYRETKAERLKIKRRKRARRAFVRLAEKYHEARAAKRADDTALYEARLESADRDAATIEKTYGEDIWPRMATVLEEVKKTAIYFNFKTGMILRAGDRVCLRSTSSVDGALHSNPKRVEVLKVDPKGTFFSYRKYGSAMVEHAKHPSALIGSTKTGMEGHVEKVPLEVCGGWDDAEERQAILGNGEIMRGPQVPAMSKVVVDRLGPDLWPAILRNAFRNIKGFGVTTRIVGALVSSYIGFLPLRRRADDLLVLLSGSQLRRIVRDTQRAAGERGLLQLKDLLEQDFELVVPADRWGSITEALRRDRARAIDTFGVDSRDLTLRPLSQTQDSNRLTSLARRWFSYSRRDLALGSAFTEMKRRSKLKQEVREAPASGV